MTILNTLARTYDWFVRARPEPGTKDFASQLGVHFEEISEMIDCISTDDRLFQAELASVNIVVKNLARKLKGSDGLAYIKPEDEIEFLDSLLDQIVTGTGVGYTKGYAIVGGLDEVNRSNFSKFDANGNPIYDDNKKVQKGPNYTKANLEPYLNIPAAEAE